MFFNKFINKLKPYKVSSHKAWETENATAVLKLDWNESTLPPSPSVNTNIKKFLDTGLLNWYPDVDNSALRNKLAEYCNLSTEFVDYFASSDSLHEYVIRAFVSEGDIVTLISPTYDNIRACAESVGAEIDYFYLTEENDFEFDFDKFEEHLEITNPKIVYLCNPNNPTGTLYDVDTIERLIKRFNDVFFIIDEAYYEFSLITASPLVPNYENLIICRTFSKAFGLASFRIGYAISSSHNINGLKKIKNQKNISTFAQIAALSCLDDLGYMRNNVERILKAKDYFIMELATLGFEVCASKGGNYVLVRLGVDSSKIISKLEDNSIFVRNYGHVPHMDKFTRITVGTLEQMKTVSNVLKEIIENK